MRRTLLCSLAAMAGLVTGCTDNDVPNVSGVEDHFVEAVVVQPVVATILVDDPITAADQTTLRATLYNKAGTALTGLTFLWRSSDPTVATVDNSGVVSAVGLGTAEITASAGKVGRALVEVLPKVKAITVSSPVSQVLARDTIQLTATAFNYSDAPMAATFTWSSSAPAVASVDATGRVIFLAPGSATFTAQSAFRSGAVTITALARTLLSVEAGGDFSCGATALGRAYCFGRGDAGQLATAADSSCFNDGAGERIPCTLEPKRAEPPDVDFRVISAGGAHGCGVSAQQLVYCWGQPVDGQIGNGGGVGGGQPLLATVGSERFTTVTAGESHTCALNVGGFGYCWGQDSVGQLGDHRRVNSTTPIPVVGPNGQPTAALRFTRISAGGNHTCAIQQGGAAFCWGDGRLGALGNGSATVSDVPLAVSGAHSFVEISAGANHTCGVTAGGDVYCWGANVLGQIGVATASAPQLTPLQVGSGYTAVTAGSEFTCALTGGRSARCWGSNSHGQLGRGEGNPGGSQVNPADVTGGLQFTSITAGRRHACGVATDGQSYCWGSNMLASLGNQLQAAVRSAPVRVAAPR
jgi:alpha-tubulin suppressor-like RCC1 family protein